MADLGELEAPVLLVVVDAEEEFDWRKPFDRSSRGISSFSDNARAHEIYEDFGVEPTYCVDQCIVESDEAVGFLSNLEAQGKCSIGAHLHPWVTPPYEEEVNVFNSFHGNLPRELEEKKIAFITQSITQVFGQKPTIFRAGRYGVGPNTIDILKKYGYEIDCSYVPHTSYAHEDGPSFIGCCDQPFWFDDGQSILEIPLTRGLSGVASGAFPRRLSGIFDAGWSRKIRIPSVLSVTGMVERIALTPEGMTVEDQKRLLLSMRRQGKQVFSLTYHSPSLSIGHTPYVQSRADLDRFLVAIREVLQFFRDEIGGEFSTLQAVHKKALSAGTAGADIVAARS
ncbi:hypothetical protein DFP90_105242 [Aestuariispira insulae]|uniref:WalW protein n=2 Tax=Aestuariispira insulae TaxID=1461337 RepID=A0A3D9HK49_9PROT|nr:hypothetical protein DFP90_105242 [Aestuariispira insulae]